MNQMMNLWDAVVVDEWSRGAKRVTMYMCFSQGGGFTMAICSAGRVQMWEFEVLMRVSWQI